MKGPCKYYAVDSGRLSRASAAVEAPAGASRLTGAAFFVALLVLLAGVFVASPLALAGTTPGEARGQDAQGGAGAGVQNSAEGSNAPQTAAFAPRYSLPLLGSYRKSMEIEAELLAACVRYGLSPALARAVLLYESGGNDGLVSGAGARGYFQVMPATFRLMKVPTNIEAGVKYLSLLLHDYGREDDALAAYNGGPGRLDRGRKLPIETLQYVVGVGIYRTLLTSEEAQIRAEASQLDLYRVAANDSWANIAARTGIPILELRLFNAFVAPRPLKLGMLIAYPRASAGPIFEPSSAPNGPVHYVTRRGDNYLLLGFAFDVDLEEFRRANTLWRVQVPFEGMRLAVGPRPPRFLMPESGGQATIGAPDPVAPTLSSAQAPDRAGAPAPGTAAAAPATGGAPGAVSPETTAAGGPRATAAPAPLIHKVKRGETLSSIARRYGVSVDTIRATNKLRHTRVVTGQILKIPAG